MKQVSHIDLPWEATKSHDALNGEIPLERLWRRGGSALSDVELLSVLLQPGCSPASALEMAQGVLAGAGLAGLLHWEAQALLRQQGFGVTKACVVIALVELMRRMARVQIPQRQLMERRDLVAGYLSLRYHQHEQEVLGALYVDTHRRLIEERELYRGTICRASVEPRAVLKPAFLCDAAGIIVFHTHPSGDPTPSTDDLQFSRRLKHVADLHGVELHDHLILGSGRKYVSLEARGSLA
jgi:DNA repair protein RadC